MWLWLSFRFDDGAFPGREEAIAQSRRLCAAMNEGLAATSKSRGTTRPTRAQAPLLSIPVLAQTAAQQEVAAGASMAGAAGVLAGSRTQQSVPARTREGWQPTLGTGGSSSGGVGGQVPALPTAGQGEEEEQEWVDPWLLQGPPPARNPSPSPARHSVAPSVVGPGAHLLDSLASSGGHGASASTLPTSLADIEAALMPEWHTSMSRFISFKGRSRLVVPPPPQPPQQAEAGAEAGQAGAGGAEVSGLLQQQAPPAVAGARGNVL